MAELITVARPYAQAAFALAGESNTLPVWAEMLRLASAVIQDPKVHAALDNPKLSAGDKESLFLALALLLLYLSQSRGVPMHRRMRGDVAALALPLLTAAAFFAYLRERMRIDIQTYREAHPDVEIAPRAWWRGIGTALLGLAFFAAIFVGVAVVLGA